MRTTQKDIAKNAGISPSFLCQIFGGKKLPSWKTAKKLEEVTGIPAPDWFEKPGEEIRAAITGTLTEKE